MKKAQLMTCCIIVMLLSTSLFGATTYYSQNSGNPSTLTNWNSSSGGGGSTPSNFTTNGDVFIIQASHTMVTTTSWTIGSGIAGNVVTLQIEGNLSINGNNDAVTISSYSVVYFESTNTVLMAGAGSSGNTFTLSQYATLKTINTHGISGASCSLPAGAANIYVNLNAGANYVFCGSSNQGTLGLPSPLNGGLTISWGSGGVTASASFTMNGALVIDCNNPSTTKGCLDMGSSYVLTMGSAGTTDGVGDVTGTVTRTSFVPATSYTFGSRYTTINFQNVGTLPSSVSVKITIGTAPSWKTSAILRSYLITQTGASADNLMTLKLSYRDAELNSNTENLLDFYDSDGFEHSRSNFDPSSNWVEMSGELTTYVGATKSWTLANSAQSTVTWVGGTSGATTNWATATNWSPAVVPDQNTNVIISTNTYIPTLLTSESVNVKTLTLIGTGYLYGASGSTITIHGGSGAWLQRGYFMSGGCTLVFTNAAATIAGNTNTGTGLYNVTINPGAVLTVGTGAEISISGTITNNGTFNAAQNVNTVDYIGSPQTVLNPNGSTPGYSSLTLIGAGTTTMPATNMNISGTFSISAGTVTALSALTIGGSVNFYGGIFNAGSFTHNVGGNWNSNGTTINSDASTINFNGSGTQTIGGSHMVNFNNITINNTGTIIFNTTNCYFTALSLHAFAGSQTKVSRSSGSYYLSLASLTLEDDAELVVDQGVTMDDNNSATVKRNMGSTGAWHYFCFPITVSNPKFFRSNPTSNYIKWYDEPNDIWHYMGITVPTGDSAYSNKPAWGYALWANTGTSFSFTGTVNNGTISTTVTRTNVASLGQYNGWNLVGNPYPCTLNLASGDLMTTDWIHLDPWAYFWHPGEGGGSYTGGNYDVYGTTPPSGGTTHTQYVPAMQGFFVHVNSGYTSGTYGVGNEHRTFSGEGWLKSQENGKDFIKVKAVSGVNGSTDQVSVYFKPGT
jgi:hypothetical protein